MRDEFRLEEMQEIVADILPVSALIMACRQLLYNSKKRLYFASTQALEGVGHTHSVSKTLESF